MSPKKNYDHQHSHHHDLYYDVHLLLLLKSITNCAGGDNDSKLEMLIFLCDVKRVGAECNHEGRDLEMVFDKNYMENMMTMVLNVN